VCEHENPADVRFCGECGARLDVLCSACGAGNPSTNKFCHGCGGPLIAPADTPKFGSPDSYTPPHLARKILTSRSALEGERKLVSVLFCDLVSSSDLAERLGPEGMHALLNSFFETALTEVHRYEGTVNQFLGDGFRSMPNWYGSDTRRSRPFRPKKYQDQFLKLQREAREARKGLWGTDQSISPTEPQTGVASTTPNSQTSCEFFRHAPEFEHLHGDTAHSLADEGARTPGRAAGGASAVSGPDLAPTSRRGCLAS
jgi:hypothetical protein